MMMSMKRHATGKTGVSKSRGRPRAYSPPSCPSQNRHRLISRLAIFCIALNALALAFSLYNLLTLVIGQ
jgi:hypothetical protein